MPLIEDGRGDPAAARQNISVGMLHRLGCKLCPLACLPNRHPNMAATGAKRPLIYILGEAPGKDEDEQGRQFVGASGEFLHRFIPRKYRDKIRYNNVVRTRPKNNADPDWMSIEACRPSVQRDIEESKPVIILGFGNVPLNWLIGWSRITMWRGRRVPVKIGEHTAWFYPMYHPSYIIRKGKKGSVEEHVFKLDMQRVFNDIDVLTKPHVHTPDVVWDGIECITERGSTGLRKLRKAVDWAIEQPTLGFDYETNALRPYGKKNKILTAAFGTWQNVISVPVEHPESQWKQSELPEVYAELERLQLEATGRVYVHNLAFELEWSSVKFSRKLARSARWEDTAVQAAILDERRGENKPGAFSLEFLVQQYFGFNLKKLSNVNRKNLAKTPLETVLLYNGADAKYHCWLGKRQHVRILDEGLNKVYKDALRRVPTLVLSQVKGIPSDESEVKKLAKKYSRRARISLKKILGLKVIKKFVELKHKTFNPGSSQHVLMLLRDVMKRKEIMTKDKYTDAIKFSTDEESLNKIDHPICKHLLIWRKATKRLGTYITPYLHDSPDTVIHPDGLIHPQYNSFFAETGRLSSEEPNIQNIIKRSDEGKEVRRHFVAEYERRRKRIIVACDYGQIEARLIAVASEDKVFTKALWEDYDVHMEWAERIAHAYPSRIGGRKMLKDKKAMKDLRTDVKSEWTFPLFFGASLGSAAMYLHIPEEVLQPLYEEFWRVFTGVKDWQEELMEFYKDHGYVETLTGRRRRAPLSLNQVINSPIQGTAAEVVMDAMCRFSEMNEWVMQPEINIHDDLTWMRMPIDRLDELSHRIVDTMLTVPYSWAKKVPWVIEMSIGENWLEMETVGDFSSRTWKFNNAK